MMINATTDPGLSNPDHMMKHTYVYKEERLSSMICFWIRQCLSRAKFALNKNHFAQCRNLNSIFTDLKKILIYPQTVSEGCSLLLHEYEIL